MRAIINNVTFTSTYTTAEREIYSINELFVLSTSQHNKQCTYLPPHIPQLRGQYAFNNKQ